MGSPTLGNVGSVSTETPTAWRFEDDADADVARRVRRADGRGAARTWRGASTVVEVINIIVVVVTSSSSSSSS
jgi:hypothetical protein